MKFQLLPLLDVMIDYYQKPRAVERFQDYQEHKTTLDYATIFTFLYGDKAAEELGYSAIGAWDFMGFQMAQAVCEREGIDEKERHFV